METCSCGAPHDITIKVRGITDCNRTEKMQGVIEELAKALRVPTKLKTKAAQAEVPLKIVSHTEEPFLKEMRDVFKEVLVLVSKKMGLLQKADVPFKLKGRFVIDPETGEILSQRQWQRFKTALDDYLEKRTKTLAERLVAKQTALGRITQRLAARGVDPEDIEPSDIRRQPTPESVAALQDLIKRTSLRDIPRFAAHDVGIYVTSINEKVRNDSMRTVNDAIQEKTTTKELASRLFQLDGDWNKDWERIAVTESQNAFNDGYLISEIDSADPKEDVYMIGMGAGNACPICQRDIIGKVVKVLDGPPEDGDENIRDPYATKAIWPGKTAVGVSAKESVAVSTRHPHCRCRWARWYPPKRKTAESGSAI